MEILFNLQQPQHLVMLRHEASATDETDASCLSMTVPTKKIGMYSRTVETEKPQDLLFKTSPC